MADLTDRAIEFLGVKRHHAHMGYDWTDDDTLSPEELRARVAALPKAEVRDVETMPGTVKGGVSTLAFATAPSSKAYRYSQPLGSESELATVVA